MSKREILLITHSTNLSTFYYSIHYFTYGYIENYNFLSHKLLFRDEPSVCYLYGKLLNICNVIIFNKVSIINLILEIFNLSFIFV